MPAASDDAPLSAEERRRLSLGVDQGGAILAVSGGSDSMALMHLYAERIAHPWESFRGTIGPVVVATVDHGLRAEATEEAAFVARLAAAHGFEHVTLRWEGDKPSTGLQAAAREARYALLFAEAKRRDFSRVVVAHTLDDQAETVLMRLARGSGPKGLGGMLSRATRDGTSLERPLLDVPRARLRATLRADGVPWIEDASNADERFLRVRLRRILPLLAEEGLDARRFAAVAEKMRRAEEALDEVARRLVRSSVRFSQRGPSPSGDENDIVPVDLSPWHNLGIPDAPGGPGAPAKPVSLRATTATESLCREPLDIRMRVLRLMITCILDHAPEIEDAQILWLAEEVFNVMAHERPSRTTLAGALIDMDYERVLVTRAPPRKVRPRTKS